MVNHTKDALSAVFFALSDPTRRGIVQALTMGAQNAHTLAEPFSISLPAISKHLRVLENAGVITRRIQGRIHHFSLERAQLQAVTQWLEEQEIFWRDRLMRLDSHLRQTREESPRKGPTK